MNNTLPNSVKQYNATRLAVDTILATLQSENTRNMVVPTQGTEENWMHILRIAN